MRRRALISAIMTTSLLGGFLMLACREDVTAPRSSVPPLEHLTQSSATLGAPQLLLAGISEESGVLLDGISDDRVSYRTSEGGDIYVFDISERHTDRAITRITTDGAGAFHGPGSISGDRVVWSRDQAQLYQFSLVTHEESALGLEQDREAPYALSGDWLALGEFNFNGVSSLHNLVTGETRTEFAGLPSDCGNCTWAFTGDRLVFPESYGEGHSPPTRLFVYDISEGSKQPITSLTDDVDQANISGDRIVYTSGLDGLAYLFDLGTHTARQIPFAGQIVGDHLVGFNPVPDVVHIDLSTGVQTAIPGIGLLSESWIVWASLNETTGFWDLHGIPLGRSLTVKIEAPSTLQPLIASRGTQLFCKYAEGRVPPRYPELPAGKGDVVVRTTYTDGSSPRDVAVAIKMEFVAASGGHNHRVGDADRGVFGKLKRKDWPADENADGVLTTTFTAGTVGGKVRLTAAGRNGKEEVTDEDTVTIDFGGLTELVSGADYTLIGNEGGDGLNHLRNHWLVSGIDGAVAQIALDIRKVALVNQPFLGPALGPFVLQYNDASLERGGMFDINGAFDSDGPAWQHALHRQGMDIDVAWVFGRIDRGRIRPGDAGAKEVPFAELERALSIAAPGARVGNEGDHYHVRFLPCPL